MSGTAPSILNAPIPTPSIKFLNDDGSVAQQWLSFLTSLSARTAATTIRTGGGGSGTGIASAELLAGINNLAVLSALEVDVPPRASVTFAFDMEETATRPAIDPLLAALMVSDV